MSKHSIAVLVSGGLDSCALLFELSRNRKVVPVYIRQGLAWEEVELYWLHQFLMTMRDERLQPVIVFSSRMDDLYQSHWSVKGKGVPGARTADKAVYLPGRNLTLTLKVAIFCAMNKIPTIALGSLGHNPFPDASPRFFRTFAKALSMGLGKPIRIVAPYRAMSKVEVIRRHRSLPLELSFSCIDPKRNGHCGRCNKCAERKKAFRKAGVEDKTVYAK